MTFARPTLTLLLAMVATGCNEYRTITIRAVHVDGAPAEDALVEPLYAGKYRLFSRHPDPALGTGRTNANGEFTGRYDASGNPNITVRSDLDWGSVYPFAAEHRNALRRASPVITVVLDRRSSVPVPNSLLE